MGVDDECLFCKIMFLVPAGHACAAVGDLDRARDYLTQALTVAARWDGSVWQAMNLELEAHLEQAEGRDERARTLLARAAELFLAAGQVTDAERCRRGGRGADLARSTPPTGSTA